MYIVFNKIAKRKKIVIPVGLIGLVLLIYLSLFTYFYINNSSAFASNASYANVSISRLNLAQAEQKINQEILSKNIIISANNLQIESTAADLGVYIEPESLQNQLSKIRLRSALLPFVYNKKIEVGLAIDDVILKNSVQSSIPQDKQPAVNASYSVENNQIVVIEGKKGIGAEPDQFKSLLLDKLTNNEENIDINIVLQEVNPAVNQDTLNNLKPVAQSIYANNYSISDENEEYKIDKNSLINYLTTNNNLSSLELNIDESKKLIEATAEQASYDAVNEVTTKYKSGKQSKITTNGQSGRSVNNIDELAKGLSEAVSIQGSYSGNFEFDKIAFSKKTVTIDDTIPSVTYKYKITTWGKTISDLNDFATKVAQTLADGRGWANTGAKFIQVNSSADFEIVLSEPSELPARYPGTCDAFYSCRVGRYVIINEDRWRMATPVWTGNLRDYQHMVINHEVGHRLGQGHQNCPAVGQLAPVMQQQSINLQGCEFNPWPLPFEIDIAKRSL